VCEGLPDALIAAQAGFVAAGVLGTQAVDGAVAERIAQTARTWFLSGPPPSVAVVVDADVPGRAAGGRLVYLLHGRNVPASVVEPPDGLDLTEWARANPSWTLAVVGGRTHDVVRDELWAALRSGPDRAALVRRLEAELDRVSAVNRRARHRNDRGGIEL
jgi:hypothetical protein